ncbi:heavy-metal-associated domain-containing protein, partial [Mycobacterium tuberculosis]|nr:heavy-metal-associated domain-containing protein [Mycobacterium tuberculosis]
MTTTTITVSGMTCGHCVASVKEEIGALPGVSDVAVDLNAGGDSPVTITSANDLDDAD